MAACSGPSGGQSLEFDELSPGVPFNCDDAIDVVETLPDNYSAFADAMALPTDVETMQRGRSSTDGRRFSKMGLIIRPGTTFQIHVAPTSQGNALIHWGNAGINDPSESIAVESCGGDPETWIAFPGGVWTLEPACVTLLVTTEVEREQLELPISMTCP